MTNEDIKALKRAVRKAKRIASERAGQLQDLAEGRMTAAYGDVPEIARAAYDACRNWALAEARLKAAAAGGRF